MLQKTNKMLSIDTRLSSASRLVITPKNNSIHGAQAPNVLNSVKP